MGTALSEDHYSVKKLTSNITLMFDGDFAGQEAILKLENIYLNMD